MIKDKGDGSYEIEFTVSNVVMKRMRQGIIKKIKKQNKSRMERWVADMAKWFSDWWLRRSGL